MAVTVSDILVSPATVWYAPVAEPLPDETTVAPGAVWGGNWKELGSTLEPVSLSYETEKFALEVEQSTAVVRQVRQRETVKIETVLAEFNKQNLVLVTDGSSVTTNAGANQHGFDTIKAGGKVDLSYYAWGFEGVRVTDSNVRLPVRVFIYRGTAVLNGQLTFAKSAGVGIPIAIEAMADTSKAAGAQIMEIHNVHTNKTS